MSLHDLFTQAGRDRARRRFRLRLVRRGVGLPGLPGRPRREPGCSARATARRGRRLAGIDRALAREAPRLASMFAMFNQLAAEEPVGAERLPSRTWPRPGLVPVAFLATLAVIVALCVVLSTKVHGVMPPCLTSASETSGASSPASVSSASSSSSSSSSSPSSTSPFASSSSSSASASPLASSSSSASFGSSSASSPASSPTSTSPLASPFASSPESPPAGQAGLAGLAAFVPVRGLSCQAYAVPNK
jgi:hypothetical protein